MNTKKNAHKTHHAESQHGESPHDTERQHTTLEQQQLVEKMKMDLKPVGDALESAQTDLVTEQTETQANEKELRARIAELTAERDQLRGAAPAPSAPAPSEQDPGELRRHFATMLISLLHETRGPVLLPWKLLDVHVRKLVDDHAKKPVGKCDLCGKLAPLESESTSRLSVPVGTEPISATVVRRDVCAWGCEGAGSEGERRAVQSAAESVAFQSADVQLPEIQMPEAARREVEHRGVMVP